MLVKGKKIYKILKVFQVLYEQAVQGLQAFTFCVVNVNVTVAFQNFGDLKNHIILNNLKEKLVASCLVGSFSLKLYKAFKIALCN